jgi:hypothetical protein
MRADQDLNILCYDAMPNYIVIPVRLATHLIT